MISLERAIFQRAKLISFDEFGSMFGTFKDEAFRLELLPEYLVPEESDALETFSLGAVPPVSLNRGWCEFLDSCRGSGKKVRRVRLYPNPVTRYFRFEVLWCYRQNQLCGEDIRFIDQEAFHPISSSLPFLMDYWMFDRARMVGMCYDLHGRFLSGIQVSDCDVPPFANVIDPFLRASMSLSENHIAYLEQS